MSAKNIKSAVGLTSYFFSLPPAHVLLLGIIVAGLIFGLIIDLGNYQSPAYLEEAVIDGTTLLIIPALLSAFVIKLLIRKMPLKRILATALGGEIVYGLAYSASLLLADVNLFFAQLVLLIGAATVFVFWYVIARLVFILKYRSVIFAILQLLFYLIFFFSNQALHLTDEPFIEFAAKFYLSSFVLLIAIIIFFQIINAPMKKSFGFSSTDAATYFINQWLYSNKDLEKAFETVGQRVRTLVAVMGFNRKDDTIFFVTPYIHYGPFGNLGGSEFSAMIAESMDAKYKAKTLVFHGTVTHDLNPVASGELKVILDTIDEMIQEAEYKPVKVALQFGREDECRAETLVIDDSAFIGVSRAPLVTEDINFGLGLSMIYSAERYVENAMVVDQHNAETGEITSFEPGEEVGYRYLRALRHSIEAEEKKQNLKIGVAYKNPESSVLGKGGIKIAIISSDPEYVMVVMDCNGVTPDFNRRIVKEVKTQGKRKGKEWQVGVFTTDTHQTNMVRGVLNPMKEEANILNDIKKGVLEAEADMQEATFFANKRWFEISVLGAKQSIGLVSTVNSIIAVAKITAPLVLVGEILILFAILTKL
jgi:putative membrane protein